MKNLLLILVLSFLIYGCSKPFRLVKNSTNEISFVEICDYI